MIELAWFATGALTGTAITVAIVGSWFVARFDHMWGRRK